MINHASRQLKPGLSRSLFGRRIKSNDFYYQLSRFAISVKVDPMGEDVRQGYPLAGKAHGKSQIVARLDAVLGGRIKVYDFEAEEFGDFIWQSLFSKTLPASDYEMIRQSKSTRASARPATCSTPISMQRVQSLIPLFPCPSSTRAATTCSSRQMPWSTNLAANTQLVVRYHDAIPVFSVPHHQQPALPQAAGGVPRPGMFAGAPRSSSARSKYEPSTDALLKIKPGWRNAQGRHPRHGFPPVLRGKSQRTAMSSVPSARTSTR